MVARQQIDSVAFVSSLLSQRTRESRLLALVVSLSPYALTPSFGMRTIEKHEKKQNSLEQYPNSLDKNRQKNEKRERAETYARHNDVVPDQVVIA